MRPFTKSHVVPGLDITITQHEVKVEKDIKGQMPKVFIFPYSINIVPPLAAETQRFLSDDIEVVIKPPGWVMVTHAYRVDAEELVSLTYRVKIGELFTPPSIEQTEIEKRSEPLSRGPGRAPIAQMLPATDAFLTPQAPDQAMRYSPYTLNGSLLGMKHAGPSRNTELQNSLQPLPREQRAQSGVRGITREDPLQGSPPRVDCSSELSGALSVLKRGIGWAETIFGPVPVDNHPRRKGGSNLHYNRGPPLQLRKNFLHLYEPFCYARTVIGDLEREGVLSINERDNQVVFSYWSNGVSQTRALQVTCASICFLGHYIIFHS